ncbi:hypothetical protein BDV28DRAFT_69505 [Aspergillus coremiiformis]|uniref:DnaJ domain-containing protein n=1 Tax=Aspergillus coremiiformis TaxID=138285 RepID=A0A5N6YVW7_9EURO|nr:hypothetical protein BDV28DRAFT_69505 [Aspergillus coremiiformis]
MGQSYSSNSHEETASNQTQPGQKVDYYELLRVERNASVEEIKKAYRRRALELHPDRNYGNAEAATKLFAEIQSAYEVLSDAQERAWYDSHRDIFIGNEGKSEEADYLHGTRITTSDDILKLFSKFSPRMDFTDAPTGFYGALRETFAQLSLEERMACLWENVACLDYPTFGNRDDPEDVVRPFYAAWSSFSTKKSFAWKDAYRYSEAPDRRVRRLMEKENKRLREEAIREFNEAVRSLVAFVKKRDPRHKYSTQSESRRQEVLRQSAAAQAARSRTANQAKLREHVIQDWAKAEDAEEDSSDLSGYEVEHFECVVCHKTFKSQNQYEAHQRSKKHIKAVKQLRWEMRAQNKEFDLGGNTSSQEKEPQWDFAHTNPQHNPACTKGPLGEQTLKGKTDNYTSTARRIDTKPDEDSPHHTYCHGNSMPDHNKADYVPRKYVEERLAYQSFLTQERMEVMDNLSHQLSTSEIKDTQNATPKLGRAKQKRAKKAQRAMEQCQNIICATCNSTFPSKNQLFTHIRELNHAHPSFVTYNARKENESH